MAYQNHLEDLPGTILAIDAITLFWYADLGCVGLAGGLMPSLHKNDSILVTSRYDNLYCRQYSEPWLLAIEFDSGANVTVR